MVAAAVATKVALTEEAALALRAEAALAPGTAEAALAPKSAEDQEEEGSADAKRM